MQPLMKLHRRLRRHVDMLLQLIHLIYQSHVLDSNEWHHIDQLDIL